MRRVVGIGGLQRDATLKKNLKEVGEALNTAQVSLLKHSLEVFKTSLDEFSRKYQKDISRNPLLRSHFQKMCTAIGIDPLISSKGFWANFLGVGDFYYELAVQIVEACLLLQEQTGGLIDLAFIKERIRHARRESNVVADEDIQRAITSLKPLGTEYVIISVGSRRLLQFVSAQLSTDCMLLLGHGERRGMVDDSDLVALGWNKARFQIAIDVLLKERLAWIDDHANIKSYWFPGLFKGFVKQLL